MSKMRAREADGLPITLKPFLVFAAKNDDILKGDELLVQSSVIGPERTKVSLPHSRHDVFTSAELDDVAAALGYVETWLTQYNFLGRPQPRAAAGGGGCKNGQ